MRRSCCGESAGRKRFSGWPWPVQAKNTGWLRRDEHDGLATDANPSVGDGGAAAVLPENLRHDMESFQLFRLSPGPPPLTWPPLQS